MTFQTTPIELNNEITQKMDATNRQALYASWLDTKLGSMLAIASDSALYLLEFHDRSGLERGVEGLRIKTEAAIIPVSNPIINLVKEELSQYFKGNLDRFTTPVTLFGTDFQKRVWNALQCIPVGETRSYLDIAKAIGNPKACRAVAQANGANQLAIIIPCHRVINEDGKLGGYGGGIPRKDWLLKHERAFIKKVKNGIDGKKTMPFLK